MQVNLIACNHLSVALVSWIWWNASPHQLAVADSSQGPSLVQIAKFGPAVELLYACTVDTFSGYLPGVFQTSTSPAEATLPTYPGHPETPDKCPNIPDSNEFPTGKRAGAWATLAVQPPRVQGWIWHAGTLFSASRLRLAAKWICCYSRSNLEEKQSFQAGLQVGGSPLEKTYGLHVCVYTFLILP